MLQKPSPNSAGAYATTPMGVVLHGSRSGVTGNPTDREFSGTADYATREPNGLAWAATIGTDVLALHLPYTAWGWHARGYSSHYFGVEFAQATVNDPISDGQVRAFVWWFQQARKTWPTLPMNFPSHAMADGTPLYGGIFDGKSDVFPRGDWRYDDVLMRIMRRLREVGG